MNTDQFGRGSLCLSAEPATTTAFGIVPPAGLGTCLEIARSCDVKNIEVMNAFRLNDYDSPSAMEWNEIHMVDLGNDVSAAKLLLEGSSARTGDERKSNDLPPIGLRTAAKCSQGLLKDVGLHIIHYQGVDRTTYLKGWTNA